MFKGSDRFIDRPLEQAEERLRMVYSMWWLYTMTRLWEFGNVKVDGGRGLGR